MTHELTALTLAGLLQVIQFVSMPVPTNPELGTWQTLGNRDNLNFEGLILFSIAYVVVSVSTQSTTFTAVCAYTYLATRMLYVPAYAFGWTPWRSYIWMIGFFATFVLLTAALF